MGEVKVQSHKVCLTSYQLTSLLFCVNRPPLFQWCGFFKVWPWKSKVQVIRPQCCTTAGWDESVALRKSNQWFQRIVFHKVWNPVVSDWTSFWLMGNLYWANRKITMTLHNYWSRQFHGNLNGVNLCSSFRARHSKMSGLHWFQIWQNVWPMNKTI